MESYITLADRWKWLSINTNRPNGEMGKGVEVGGEGQWTNSPDSCFHTANELKIFLGKNPEIFQRGFMEDCKCLSQLFQKIFDFFLPAPKSNVGRRSELAHVRIMSGEYERVYTLIKHDKHKTCQKIPQNNTNTSGYT